MNLFNNTLYIYKGLTQKAYKVSLNTQLVNDTIILFLTIYIKM